MAGIISHGPGAGQRWIAQIANHLREHGMPLQNRVTPRGTIVRSSARGSLLGNRGCLHRAREIVRNHAGRRWIVCLLEFRGRRRPLMQEGR